MANSQIERQLTLKNATKLGAVSCDAQSHTIDVNPRDYALIAASVSYYNSGTPSYVSLCVPSMLLGGEGYHASNGNHTLSVNMVSNKLTVRGSGSNYVVAWGIN